MAGLQHIQGAEIPRRLSLVCCKVQLACCAVQPNICSHQGSLPLTRATSPPHIHHLSSNHASITCRPTTHSSPVVQVRVLNPDLLAAWHLVAGHQGCITLQVLPSRVIVIVHLGAQASCCWQMIVAAQVYKSRTVHGLSC